MFTPRNIRSSIRRTRPNAPPRWLSLAAPAKPAPPPSDPQSPCQRLENTPSRRKHRRISSQHFAQFGINASSGEPNVARLILRSLARLRDKAALHRVIVQLTQLRTHRAHSNNKRFRTQPSSHPAPAASRNGWRATTIAACGFLVRTATASLSAPKTAAFCALRLQTRTFPGSRNAGHTCRSASMCEQACTPLPRIPNVRAFGGASASTATAETAAVRISVINRPSITARGRPVARSAVRSSPCA